MVRLLNDWDEIIGKNFKDYYIKLRFFERRVSNAIIYPSMYDIFNALKYTSYQDTKIVIRADPYHCPNQAHGLCFR